MGYKGGGLGINGQGITHPLKVKERPRYDSLGYGKCFKSFEAKNMAIIEIMQAKRWHITISWQWRRVEYLSKEMKSCQRKSEDNLSSMVFHPGPR